jgi:hypothetical protein
MVALEAYTPTPQKQVMKGITVKKEVKREVKEPSPVLGDNPAGKG